MKSIELSGAKQNNLKNVNVQFPLGQITVICGPSGSGKSSLAFETLYAKGQREYINSLSSYARQFLDRSPQPDVDDVKNIPPAIAIEQSNHVTTNRSTVGTLTEIIDYLRLLFAHIGVPMCLKHNIPIEPDTVTNGTDRVLKTFNGQRGYILTTLSHQNNSEKRASELLKFLLQSGHTRLFHKGEMIDLCPESQIPRGSFDIVIDRLQFDEKNRMRLADSMAQAFSTFNHLNMCKKGKVKVVNTEGQQLNLNENAVCRECGFSLPPITHQLFNFSSPVGVCKTCEGLGHFLQFDKQKIIPNTGLCLSESAIHPFKAFFMRYEAVEFLRHCQLHFKINTKIPFDHLSKKEKDLVWMGHGRFSGLISILEDCERYRDPQIQDFFKSYKTHTPCRECQGSRLRKEANAVVIKGHSITEMCHWMLEDLLEFLKKLASEKKDTKLKAKLKVASELLNQICSRLQFLCDIGVNYLTLDRLTKTLSAGEYQRVNLANQLGRALSQTLYVLDEPTVGLHPKDNDRLIKILNQLKNLGNTLVVVEHDKSVIQNSQYVVEMGPGSGQHGGDIIFSGETKAFLKTPTLTAQAIKKQNHKSLAKNLNGKLKSVNPSLKITGCSGHNLKSIDVTFPLNQLIVVTGVSGSGKSSLLKGTLYPALLRKIKSEHDKDILPYEALRLPGFIKDVLFVDQSPVGRTWRSLPVTYLKIYDHIRLLMSSTKEAKRKHYKPNFFSLNVEYGGRCPHCEGEGFETIDMAFMDDIKLVCEHCKGQKFRKEVFDITYKGKHINQILDLTVLEAIDFFKDYPLICNPLSFLKEVGLEYLHLGQSTQSLSGGESQRLKLARELIQAKKDSSLYILDEPTTGLHPREVNMLIDVMRKLIGKGGTVIVIEHNIDLIQEADYVVELGPGGGKNGGQVMFQGPIELLCQNTHCATAPYLKPYFAHLK